MRTGYPLSQLDTALPTLRALPPGCPFLYTPGASSQAEPIQTDDGVQLCPLAGLGPPVVELAGAGGLTLSPGAQLGKKAKWLLEEHSSLGRATALVV